MIDYNTVVSALQKKIDFRRQEPEFNEKNIEELFTDENPLGAYMIRQFSAIISAYLSEYSLRLDPQDINNKYQPIKRLYEQAVFAAGSLIDKAIRENTYKMDLDFAGVDFGSIAENASSLMDYQTEHENLEYVNQNIDRIISHPVVSAYLDDQLRALRRKLSPDIDPLAHPDEYYMFQNIMSDYSRLVFLAGRLTEEARSQMD